jgi:hypothetical protein
MNAFLDDFLVGLVLLGGFGYAIYALGPKALRTRGVMAVAWLLGHAPAFLGLHGTAARLASTAARKSAGSCGGCDSCAPAAPTSGSVAPEVRVPLSTVRKRRSY